MYTASSPPPPPPTSGCCMLLMAVACVAMPPCVSTAYSGCAAPACGEGDVYTASPPGTRHMGSPAVAGATWLCLGVRAFGAAGLVTALAGVYALGACMDCSRAGCVRPGALSSSISSTISSTALTFLMVCVGGGGFGLKPGCLLTCCVCSSGCPMLCLLQAVHFCVSGVQAVVVDFATPTPHGA